MSLLQSVGSSVETKIINEIINVSNIVSLIKLPVITGILSRGTLVSNVISDYLSGASDFTLTGFQLLKENVCFLEELTRNLLFKAIKSD